MARAKRSLACQTGRNQIRPDKPRPTAEFHAATAQYDPDYSREELEFMFAVDRYKREKTRPFPTLREILMIVHALGYQKSLLAGE